MKINTFKVFHMVVTLFIIAVFGIIVGSIAYRASQGDSNNLSVGFNGMIEKRCIEGLTFIVGQDGNVRQVMDEYGKGKACK